MTTDGQLQAAGFSFGYGGKKIRYLRYIRIIVFYFISRNHEFVETLQ
jgi:hypothetical protein